MNMNKLCVQDNKAPTQCELSREITSTDASASIPANQDQISHLDAPSSSGFGMQSALLTPSQPPVASGSSGAKLIPSINDQCLRQAPSMPLQQLLLAVVRGDCVYLRGPDGNIVEAASVVDDGTFVRETFGTGDVHVWVFGDKNKTELQLRVVHLDDEAKKAYRELADK